MSRLSNLQRIALEDIAEYEGTEFEGEALPLYVNNLSREILYGFNTPSDQRRWLANLETRGFITIRNNCFLRLTQAGRLALAGYPPAVRRDFQAEEAARRGAEE